MLQVSLINGSTILLANNLFFYNFYFTLFLSYMFVNVFIKTSLSIHCLICSSWLFVAASDTLSSLGVEGSSLVGSGGGGTGSSDTLDNASPVPPVIPMHHPSPGEFDHSLYRIKISFLCTSVTHMCATHS